jgi:hypothetical protein
LLEGSTSFFSSSFESYARNPQSPPMRISVDSSDSSLLRVTPASVDLSGISAGATFQIQAVAPGSATLTVRNNGGFTVPPEVNESANPGVGIIERSPARLDQPPGQNIFVDFRPVGLGQTEVSAIPPRGFTIPTTRSATQNGRIRFHVTLPGWEIGQISPLPKGTTRPVGLELAKHVNPLMTDVPVVIQSTDPSRLLVSSDSAAAGSPSITMTLAAGRRFAGSFFVQALDGQGSVQLLITAPGFADTYFDIPLTNQ